MGKATEYHKVQFAALLIFLLIGLGIGCSDKKVIDSNSQLDESIVTIPFGDTVSIPGTDISVVFKRIVSDNRVILTDYELRPWLYNTAILEVALLPEDKLVYLTISGDLETGGRTEFVSQQVRVDTFLFEPISLLPLPDKNGRPPASAHCLKLSVEKIVDGLIEHSDYLPLKVGNRWIYLDSTFSEGTFVSAEARTVTVVGDYYDALGHWYQVNDGFIAIPRTLLASHDTLYSKAGGGIEQPIGKISSWRNVEFAPIGSDGFNWISQGIGDIGYTRFVYPCDSIISTPAGSFLIPFLYSGSAYMSETEYFYAPGTGIIFSEARSWNGAYVLRSTLVETDFR